MKIVSYHQCNKCRYHKTGIDEHRKTVHFCKAKCYQECLEAIDETNGCELYEPNFSTMLRIIANQ